MTVNNWIISYQRFESHIQIGDFQNHFPSEQFPFKLFKNEDIFKWNSLFKIQCE